MCSSDLIGGEINDGSTEFQNEVDASSLYQLLENQIVPLYYAKPDGKLPLAWLQLMRESIRSVTPVFNTQRMECTRGDHAKSEGWTRAREERRLAEALLAAFEREACVLIPVFALGKTQEVLAMLYQFRRQRLLPEFPIYIGGLSSKFTDIYDRRTHMTRRQLPRLKLMREVAPFVLNDETVRDTAVRGGRVYVLSSGMMIPKTLSNVFARRIIENPEHSIFFVGYANPESPAGLLREAGQGGEVALDPDKSPQRIRCNIEQFQFSAHSTRESLIDYAKRVSPKKILLVHGDPPAVEWMRTTLSNELSGSEVIVPTPGTEIHL